MLTKWRAWVGSNPAPSKRSRAGGHPGCREEAQDEGRKGPGGPGGVGHGPVGNAVDANRVT